MPTLEYLKTNFSGGYSSGNVLGLLPNRRRFSEERKIGGSYRRVFMKAAKPYLKPNSKVLELGPGTGSWSRAILKYIPSGELHTADFCELSEHLRPEDYSGRLIAHQVDNNSFEEFEDAYFDFFWSFGVLCHNHTSGIEEILSNVLRVMKPGAYAAHQFGDWHKLDRSGWDRGMVPISFKERPDEEIWWPRNDTETMVGVARKAGWEVVSKDLDILRRDGLIVLRRPC